MSASEVRFRRHTGPRDDLLKEPSLTFSSHTAHLFGADERQARPKNR